MRLFSFIKLCDLFLLCFALFFGNGILSNLHSCKDLIKRNLAIHEHLPSRSIENVQASGLGVMHGTGQISATGNSIESYVLLHEHAS